MESFMITDTEVFIRLIMAMLLGSLLGAERLFAGKTAGMRTYSLVSMGSAVFIITAIVVTHSYIGIVEFDPMRMAASIIAGVGFLGAGLIIFRDEKLRGLTTAAGLWVAAGIGVAVGFGLFNIAIMSSFITLFILVALGYLKKKLEKISTVVYPDAHRSTDHDDEV
jgi:putative Mg2+ transporter-C (MgtC) family protein